jgi:hypothetical protein
VQVGVSIEPLAEVAAKESSRVGAKLDYAKRVGMDLYQYLASFATQTNGDTIVIPTTALNRCGKIFVGWLCKTGHMFVAGDKRAQSKHQGT